MVNRKPIGGVKKGQIFAVTTPLVLNDSPQRTKSTTHNRSIDSLSYPIQPKPEEIKLRAPATLPAGYKFSVKVNNETIIATVVSK